MTGIDTDLQLTPLRRDIADLTTAFYRLRADLHGATVTPQPEWCNAMEAARRLGVSASTIRRKATSGEIEARGSGKTRQFRVLP